LPQLARLRSVVLTRHAGVGPLRVRETVSLGRLPFSNWFGLSGKEDEQAVESAMRTTGCDTLADRRLFELSDGERQRVMIARAMAQQSACMLLDEPTAFLDLPRRVEIVRLLVRLAHDCRRAVVLSTHDLDLALQTADEVWLMESDGRVHVGPPEELVLNGSFGGAFASEGIRFDPAQGRFVWREASGPPARVLGDGLQARWTEHALRRIGFRIVGADQTAALTVEAAADRLWRVFAEGEARREHASLGALLEAVRPRCEGTGDRGAID
jgi:iron complex transport system ATP-binding protein